LRPAIPHVDALIEADRVRITSLSSVYRTDQVVDEFDQVARYRAATDEAVAAGFRGLRMAADATDLVRTADQREVFTRYEHLADELMVQHPFSALCAYDRQVLGSEAIEELACMHPLSSAGATSFALHPCVVGGADVALVGEIGSIRSNVVVQSASPVVARLVDLLDLPEVSVEVPA
jgi:hypothetical protein